MSARARGALRALIGTVLLLCAGTLACGPADDAARHADGAHAAERKRGPNGGRLLVSEAFSLELGIFGLGAPPELRVWATQDGRTLAPSELELRVSLTRLGGHEERVDFEPRDDHLVSTRSIAEPHSFEISVAAVHGQERHAWELEHFEGRTRIAPEMAASLGVETEVAGPATLTQTLTVYGRVRADPERTREVRARFEGVIREVHARLGDSVGAGEKLLSIESNDSLKRYLVVSPIGGVVTQRDANPGEQTGGRRLMTITDTSSVWVDLSVFPMDRDSAVVGSGVSVAPALGGESVEGAVSLLETVADPHDQSIVARVPLEDAGAALRPGTFVTAQIEVEEFEVPLAVKRTALQSFRDVPVVYARYGEVYEVRMPELGRTAGEWVEVLGGLDPGIHYVTSNSHLVKADIEKSAAAHDH
jgi:cobalt-zinc-cadmium efflux system membrane fusion protein